MAIDTLTPPARDSAREPHVLEPLLLDLASNHHGMLTTHMLSRLGHDKFALAAMTESGALLHPCRGLYAVAELVDRSSDEMWHKHLSYGGRLLYPDATLVGATALVAHDIPVWNSNLRRPAFYRPRDRSAAASAFWVRPRVCRETLETPWGPTMPIGLSLIQNCLDHGIAQGVVSADAAIRLGLACREEVEAAAEAVASWPRSGRVRSMMTFIDERHESPGESLTYVHASIAGIKLIPQVTIYDNEGRWVARVDFVVEGTKVIVEFDGKTKYVRDDDSEGERVKGAGEIVFEEKKREDKLRALGYVVVRLVWKDFYTHGAIARKIHAGLALERQMRARR